jgi:hypothetical protein
MNVELLRKVKEHILEEPRRLIMNSWRVLANGMDKSSLARKAGPNSFRGDGGEVVEFANCGTAACISGWACIITGQKRVRDFKSRGRKILDLNEHQAERLFLPDSWPNEFYRAYEHANSQKERAKIAAARIDHFIATKGAE